MTMNEFSLNRLSKIKVPQPIFLVCLQTELERVHDSFIRYIVRVHTRKLYLYILKQRINVNKGCSELSQFFKKVVQFCLRVNLT